MGRIKKGWGIFKMSYKIAKEVKAVWGLIIISLLTSLLGFAVVAGTLFLVKTAGHGIEHLKEISNNEAFLYSVILLFVSVFIATFFNFAISYNILEFLRKKRLATVKESISFAMSRLGSITIWSLVLVSVNLFFQILNSIAERLGFVGEIIMKIINGLLGVAWNLLTLFVIPIFVENKEASLKDVMKRSKDIFVSTWGETVVSSASMGLFGFLMIFGIVTVATFLFIVTAGTILSWVIIPVAILMVLALLVFISAMDRIYKIILYLYAETKEVPEIVENKELIMHSFEEKKKK